MRPPHLSWRSWACCAWRWRPTALYLNAAAAGKNALALLTISDSLVTGEALDAESRQNTFTKMMEIALEIA